MVARSLGCRFVEGDSLHDASAVKKMQKGVPLTDEDRWPWLDRIGQAMDQAINKDRIVVVACSALRRAYRDRLRQATQCSVQFLLLDNDREAIRARLERRSHDFMPVTLLDSQFATLERPQQDELAKTLVSDLPPETLSELAVRWVMRATPVA